MKLLNFLLFFIDPFFIGRRYLLTPALNLSNKLTDFVFGKLEKPLGLVKTSMVHISLLIGVVIGATICSIIAYAAFNIVYMPAITHMRPVNMRFKMCAESGIQCSFPHAEVTLTEKQRLLMEGQEYSVSIELELPESPPNQDLGMFMVCGELHDTDKFVRANTCRSTMLQYQSPFIRIIQKLFKLPFILMGLIVENRSVAMEIFPKYVENVNHPITDVYVEIQSSKIQFYKVTLHITANFTGLRYLMYRFPVISAIFGVGVNFAVLCVSSIALWYLIPMVFINVLNNALLKLQLGGKKTKEIEDITPKFLLETADINDNMITTVNDKKND